MQSAPFCDPTNLSLMFEHACDTTAQLLIRLSHISTLTSTNATNSRDANCYARFYINGGCWLWAADTFFYRSAVWAGVADAEAARQNRLLLEVYHAFASHESMTAQGAATALEGYGSNALMLLT
jgi:hypothetical protein